MINEFLYLLVVLAAGLLLGGLFFGGLWFTIQKAVGARYPALWIVGSFFVRVGLVLGGFYLVAAGDWKKFLVCLLGFVVARYAVTHFTKIKANVKSQDRYEA